MSFVDAAQNAGLPLEDGKGAIEGRYRNRIDVQGGSSLLGSVDLDKAFKKLEPNSNRWDYCVGISKNGENFAFWIEPHSASSKSEIAVMKRKREWVIRKLSQANFAQMKELTDSTAKAGFVPFRWLAAGRCGFRAGGKISKQLAAAGLAMPESQVSLPK